eukprot:SAG31_NODE_2172_length_6259_cov_2.500162_3_plen_99_part_00
MGFHPDDCSGGLLTLDQRQSRVPYGPPDMLSAFVYLTDTDHTTPCFAVVPKSRRIDNMALLKDTLGDEYAEVPIVGPGDANSIRYARSFKRGTLLIYR